MTFWKTVGAVLVANLIWAGVVIVIYSGFLALVFSKVH